MSRFILSHLKGVALALGLALGVFSATPSGAATAEDIAEDFDNYFVPVFPTVYGEIINTLPSEEVTNVSAVLRGLEIFGYLKSMGDIANAIDSGDNAEAAIETASTLAKMIVSYGQAQGATGFAVMGSSVGMLPVTALITAIDLARSSRKAVNASKTALDLEALYGSVEHDREIRDSNRKLGEGDPIKVTPASIERLWRRVIFEANWGELFKTYVTSELGQPWPEPSLWDRLSIPAEVRREALLFEEEKRLKSHISTLLLELNKVAKKREAEVVLAKMMREMAAQALKIDPNQFRDALTRYREAMSRLPEIQKYAIELPEKVKKYQERFSEATTLTLADHRKKYGKEPSVALTELRLEILQESQDIIQHAQTLRLIPPNDKKGGGERKRLLTLFKENYLKLWPIRDSISNRVVNARLLAETQAMTEAQTEFTFTRHAPEKGFAEYAKDFIEPVRQGEPGAEEKLGKAQSALTADQEKMEAQYQEDFQANQVILKEKADQLANQLKSLEDQYSRTSDPQQRSALLNAIEQVRKQQRELQQRWEKYTAIHQLNVKIDNEHFAEVKREFLQFLEANRNRYATVWEAITTHYRDASGKYDDFSRMRLNNARHPESFLSEEELARLRKVIDDNPGGYIGIPESFLAQHMPKTLDDQARSMLIMRTVDAMQKEILRQMGLINQHRMEHYADWDVYTLPSLKYMTSREAAAEIKNVSDAIATALKFIASIDPSDIQRSSQATLKSMIEGLESRKQSVDGFGRHITLASGIASQFETYLSRARKNNDMIADDSRFLSSLYSEFQPAASQLSMTVGMFVASNRNYLALAGSGSPVMPEILPGSQIVDILRYRDILRYSAEAELGLEQLVEDPFAELPVTGSMVSLTAAYLGALENRIRALPTSSYAAYQPEMQKLLDENQANRTLFQFARIDAFQAKFAFDGQLSGAMKRLAKAIADILEEVNRNQAARDREADRYAAILSKLNAAIEMARSALAAKDWATAAGLQTFSDLTRESYMQLGQRSSDVDSAFGQLQKMIDEGKLKLGMAAPPSGSVAVGETQVRELYQSFVDAYGRGDIRGILGLLASDWHGGDGADPRDVEDTLINSFKVFDRIQYRISGFSVQPIGDDQAQVSYSVKIIGDNSRQRLHHEEESQIVEVVGLVDGKPRILRTLSGSQWLR